MKLLIFLYIPSYFPDFYSTIFDLIQKRDNSGYYFIPFLTEISSDFILAELTNDFEILNWHVIQHGLFNSSNINFDSDSTYIISSKDHYDNETDLAIIKCDTLHNELNYVAFGKSDTVEYAGACDNLTFNRLTDDFYFSGTSNVNSSLTFQKEPSWLIINNIDKNFELNWQKYFGGDAFYFNYIAYATDDGGILLLNHRYNYNDNQDYDLHILKLDSEGNYTNIENPEIKVSELILFPNPATTEINIRLGSHLRDITIEIYDLSGKIVLEQKLENFNTQINISTLNSGIYIFKCYDDKRIIENRKFVKE